VRWDECEYDSSVLPVCATQQHGDSHPPPRIYTIHPPLAPQPQSSQVRPTGTEIANVQVKVQGIAPDPLDPHRIACWNGKEGIVMIWDARKLKEPVLTFGERDALANGGYEDRTQETRGEVLKSSPSPPKSMPLIKGTNPSPPIHRFPSLLFVVPAVSCREWKGRESRVPFPFLPPSPQKATPRPIYDLHRLP
jgi:hypothetical protein